MSRPVGNLLRKLKLYDSAITVLQLIETLQRSRKYHRYIREHEIKKLQIGCGLNIMDDWLNTDVFITDRTIRDYRSTFLDAAKPFPFNEDTFDYVFCAHMIEHISWKEGLQMLREAYRVLKPGGKIRVATPNIRSLMSLYNLNKDDIQQEYIQYSINLWLPEVAAYGLNDVTFVVNNFMRNWGHQFVYDPDILQKSLQLAGFINYCSEKPGESKDVHLQNIEYDQNHPHKDFYNLETMVLEAEKSL
jgi:predicted SAM-dependent methyltransferase